MTRAWTGHSNYSSICKSDFCLFLADPSTSLDNREICSFNVTCGCAHVRSLNMFTSVIALSIVVSTGLAWLPTSKNLPRSNDTAFPSPELAITAQRSRHKPPFATDFPCPPWTDDRPIPLWPKLTKHHMEDESRGSRIHNSSSSHGWLPTNSSPWAAAINPTNALAFKH